MKKILFFTLFSIFMLQMQSCDYIMLSAKERQVKGIWKQSFFFGKAIQSFKGNKTVEMYYGLKIMGIEAMAHFTGTWEVAEDRLIIEMNGDPDIQFKGNNYIEDFLQEHRNKMESAISSGKLIKVDDEKLIVESDGTDIVWKAGNQGEWQEMRDQFNKLAQESN